MYILFGAAAKRKKILVAYAIGAVLYY